jgi:hypothetical protein
VKQAQFPVQQPPIGNGQNLNRNEPSLRDIIREQVRINDEVGKKIHTTDNLLENINAKMDNIVEVSYAAPQGHGIVNVALHREYSPDMIFIFSQGRKDLNHV